MSLFARNNSFLGDNIPTITLSAPTARPYTSDLSLIHSMPQIVEDRFDFWEHEEELGEALMDCVIDALKHALQHGKQVALCDSVGPFAALGVLNTAGGWKLSFRELSTRGASGGQYDDLTATGLRFHARAIVERLNIYFKPLTGGFAGSTVRHTVRRAQYTYKAL